MALLVLLVSAGHAAAAPKSPHGSESLSPANVVPIFKFTTASGNGSAVHGRAFFPIDTAWITGLRGATPVISCPGCGRPARQVRGHRLSTDHYRWTGLHWIVSGRRYIEVDVRRSGYVGRWLRLDLVRVRASSPRYTTCLNVGTRRWECLVNGPSGCLSGLTKHVQCPVGTAVLPPAQIPSVPAPNTRILSAPRGSIDSRSVTISYSSDSSHMFECSLNDGTWVVCPDGQQEYDNLPDGPYRFEVAAVSSSGQPDPSPQTATWTVDTTPPSTTFRSGPLGPVQTDSVTFTYASSEGGSHFQCDFDNQGWQECDGGRITLGSDVRPLPHTLLVRAIDDAGNVDPNPASTSWIRYPATGMPYSSDDQDALFQRGGPSTGWYTGSGGGLNSYSYFANYLPCLGDTEANRHYAKWTTSPLPAGLYNVYAWIPMAYDPSTSALGAPLSSAAQFTISSSLGTTTATVDQLANRGEWAFVAQVQATGVSTVQLDDAENSNPSCTRTAIIADALKFVYQSPNVG
jgi:hypothetical protein